MNKLTSKQTWFNKKYSELVVMDSFDDLSNTLQGLHYEDRMMLLRTLYWDSLAENSFRIAEMCIDLGFQHPEESEEQPLIYILDDAIDHLSDSPEAIEWLIEKGASVEGAGVYGGYTPLMKSASMGYINVVRVLLKHGANKEYKAKIDGCESALDLARINSHYEIEKILN